MKSVRLLTALGLCVAAGMLILGGTLLFGLRQEAWRQAEQASSNLVTALERDIERSLTVYDLSVQGTIEVLAEPGLAAVSPNIRHSALFDRAATAEYLASLLVLGPDGKIVDDSTSIVPHPLNLGDRDYFTVHRDNPDAGLFISRPFRSRLRNKDASMAISRRRPAPDGHFEGVVVGSLRLALFEKLFSALDLGPHGAVTLARDNGDVIVRLPLPAPPPPAPPPPALSSPAPPSTSSGTAAPSAPVRDVSETEPGRLPPASAEGRFVAVSAIDGVRRVFTYRRIGTLPLVVTVGLGIDDIFHDWWRKALSIGSILLLLSSATITLCLLFRREMQRRLRAEAALTASADRLAVMAATDGLTGLANRRAFEAELVQEWKRAARNETPLGLLLIDADWFKPFNDLYGHQEGDEALRKIAASIQRIIRRPADLGARYGGEEFVILLPETDLDGSFNTANRLCQDIAALGLEHKASAFGHVTVSVGVAVMWPHAGGHESTLVRQADKALYGAKRAGRGRVAIDDGPAPMPPLRAAIAGQAPIAAA